VAMSASIPVAHGFPALPPVKLDAGGMLDEDIRCRRCAYNLRSLSPMGRCPECGTAVGRSIQGDFLRFCEPDWVGTLASGMRWIVAGIALAIVLGLVCGGLAGAGVLSPVIINIILYGTSVVGFVGYWKVTTPDPGVTSKESGLDARNITRLAQVAGLVVGPLPWISHLLPELLNSAILIFSSIVGIAGTIAALLYSRRLALRIPDDKLATSCRSLMWFAGLVMMLGLASLVAVVVIGPGAILGVGVTMGLGLMGLFCLLWGVSIIEKFRKAFREAAKLARNSWAATPT